MDDETRVRRAATFDRAADVYERARPEYPAAALDWALPAGTGRVLDLGAGTGKLTRSLVAHGWAVTAADASPAMLEQLRAALPDVETRVTAAEATGFPDASFDAVTVAAAFHWFARPAADAEIARILRPGGVVALFWNGRDRSDPTAAAFDRAAREANHERPHHDRNVVLDPRWFGPTERAEFPNQVTVTAERLVGMVASRSYVIDLPDDARQQVLDGVRRFAHDDLGLSGDATTSLALRSVVLRARRLD